MKLKVQFNPDLVALTQAEIAAGEKAVSTAMREAGTSLKSAWRGQITGAGLGTRLGNSIRLASFPKSGDSLNAAALVWSNAPVIVGAHNTGPLIRSKDGFWLAIPTPAAGKSTKGGRITPRRMGTSNRSAPTVRLSPSRAEPAGGRGADQLERPRGSIEVENRAWSRDCPDFPAGTTGSLTQAAGSGAGC